MKKTVSEGKLFQKQDAVAFCLIGVYLFFLAWRVRYGFSVPDEGCYVGFAHRFLTGDGLIADEWHLAQFLAFFEYLPAKIFTLATGSTDGMLLYFRYIHVLFQAFVLLYTYLILRKRTGCYSVMMTCAYMLSASVCMSPVLSYYLTGAGLIYCTAVTFCADFKRNVTMRFFSGILLALAVLCYSPNAIIFFIYFAVVFISAIRKKSIAGFTDIKTFLLLAGGICITAVLFFIFLLSHTSISELVSAAGYLFKDPEHTGFVNAFLSSVRSLYSAVKLLLLFIAVALAAFFDKKREEHIEAYCALISVAALVEFILTVKDMSVSASSVVRLSYLAALVSADIMAVFRKYNNRMAVGIFLCGASGTLCAFFASTSGYLASAPIANICAIPGFICISEYNAQKKAGPVKKKEDKTPRLITACICLSVLIFYCTVPFFAVKNIPIWEKSASGASSLDSCITSGPYAGIYTTSERKKIYDDIIEDLSFAKEKSVGKLMVPDSFPWMYIFFDREYGSFSNWMMWQNNEKDERLTLYYSFTPEHIPQIIYIPSVDAFYFEKTDSASLYEKVNELFDYETIRTSDAGNVLLVTAYKGEK